MNIQTGDNSTKSWQVSDSQHHMHPFTDNGSLREKGGPRVIIEGKGVWLEDSDGQVFSTVAVFLSFTIHHLGAISLHF